MFKKDYHAGAGSLVEWLREETCNQYVVSLNPGARYWME